MSGILLPLLIALVSMSVPGLLLTFALLRKTELHLFEIVVIGLTFGLIAPATLTWAESYLIHISSFFTFSVSLFELNALVLTILGAVLCYQQGAFGDFMPWLNGIMKPKGADQVATGSSETKKHAVWWVWTILTILMIITFYTRIANIGTAPNFFEFDPYFDMLATESILGYGQQYYLSHSAWPVVSAGTSMRIQPLIPYLEAYWYDLANMFGSNYHTFNTALMSYVGSIYPPIAAALLVFVIFVLLYHEYDEYIALIGAAFTASMPVLITTFIAGEQLLEPWGIFALFFFFAAYMLAIRNMKSKRLAIFAGLAFVVNFLGAHYYTVDTGVLSLYILIQCAWDIIKDGHIEKDFYKMNAIVLSVIAAFLVLYKPYNAVYGGGIPVILGFIPTTIAFPIISLLFVFIMEYLVKNLSPRLTNLSKTASRLAIIVALLIIGIVLILTTPLGNPVRGYLNLSVHFTTPSSPLFMTVEEYIPTGLFYDFGAQGLGVMAASLGGIPIVMWSVIAISMALLFISIIYRNSKTAILYVSIAVPLMFAGFSEVKYLPHLGISYIMLFGIMLGEFIYMADINFNLAKELKSDSSELGITRNAYSKGQKSIIAYAILSIGLFFLSPFIAIAFLLLVIIMQKVGMDNRYLMGLIVGMVILAAAGFITGHPGITQGEIISLAQVGGASATYSATPALACNSNYQNSISSSLGAALFCNTIPQYWLDAMSWISANVGPHAPRVLAWWDYGDWINWFGNSNAVLRGDNSVPKEDYAVAASYVLGSNDSFGPAALANLMNGNQTEYALFDRDLLSKWGALDFLGCVGVNQTSMTQAIDEAKLLSSGTPYVLGYSQCEIAHDPQSLLVPYCAIVPGAQGCGQQNLGYYCAISTPNQTYIRSFLLTGQTPSNTSVCLGTVPNPNGVLSIYNTSAKKINAVVQDSFSLGLVNIGNITFIDFPMIYLPNGPNGTITDAPSAFYNSNYYRAFFLGYLPGFTEVYPANATGTNFVNGTYDRVNFVNGTYDIRIYKLNNYTGGNVPVPQKPSYVANNYTMP